MKRKVFVILGILIILIAVAFFVIQIVFVNVERNKIRDFTFISVIQDEYHIYINMDTCMVEVNSPEYKEKVFYVEDTTKLSDYILKNWNKFNVSEDHIRGDVKLIWNVTLLGKDEEYYEKYAVSKYPVVWDEFIGVINETLGGDYMITSK